MHIAIFLFLYSALSIMSVWYIADTPGMYCLAIISGMCMETWSLYFFFYTVFESESDRQFLLFGVLGSLFGALAFGCRPTIAIANILAVPLFLYHAKAGRKRFCRQFLLCLIPYIVIGLLLMTYNYVRFENVFEFGQSYQLTAADQSNYGSILSRISVKRIVKGVYENVFVFCSPTKTFPHLSFSSVIGNFPIVGVAWICLCSKRVRISLAEKGMCGFTATLFLLPFLITCMESLMSPWLLERYRSDIYWMFGILIFLVFGLFLQHTDEKCRRKWSFLFAVVIWSTIIRAFLLWMVPWDFNFTKMRPEWLSIFEQIFTCGYIF